jgi:hypothetical protein
MMLRLSLILSQIRSLIQSRGLSLIHRHQSRAS